MGKQIDWKFSALKIPPAKALKRFQYPVPESPKPIISKSVCTSTNVSKQFSRPNFFDVIYYIYCLCVGICRIPSFFEKTLHPDWKSLFHPAVASVCIDKKDSVLSHSVLDIREKIVNVWVTQHQQDCHQHCLAEWSNSVPQRSNSFRLINSSVFTKAF